MPLKQSNRRTSGQRECHNCDSTTSGANAWYTDLASSQGNPLYNCSACYWYRPRNSFERPSTLFSSFHAPSTHWSSHTLDIRIVGPGAGNSMSEEQLVLGDETGLQARLNERLGQPVTASLQAQHHRLQAADFKASVLRGNARIAKRLSPPNGVGIVRNAYLSSRSSRTITCW